MTYFCLAFWWRGLHATTTLLTLKWTFCLCVFNVSSKTAGQRQGQLSHRTAATIVCMFAYTCVHGPSAPRCKLYGWKCVFCLDLGKFGLEQHQLTFENACNVSYSCIWHVGEWNSGFQITSKYWHQADCLVYNLNFSMAHFLLQHAPSAGLLAYIFLICKQSWLRFNILWNMTNKLEWFHMKCTFFECVFVCVLGRCMHHFFHIFLKS